MSGHTPGPWEWEEREETSDGRKYQALTGGPVPVRHAPVLIHQDARWWPSEADARLIAAAPLLLEVLDFLERRLRACAESGAAPHYAVMRGWADEARAAIAAATGEGGAA